MNTLRIAIPLPNNIKAQLQRVCYGLPDTFWEEEENFHITLLSIKEIEGGVILDIKEKLIEIAWSPFSLTLQGIDWNRQKGGSGTIWGKIKENPELIKLKSLLIKAISPLDLSLESLNSPHVKLAYYKKLHDQKLADYLETNSSFISSSFLVDCFILYEVHKTAKHTIYIEQGRFILRSP